MVDWVAVNSILSTRNGVWTIVTLLLVVAWRGWPHVPAIITAWSARRQAIQAAKDADWSRLRGEVASYREETAAVKALHQKCEDALHAEREQRIKDIAGLHDDVATERAERMRLERLLFAEGEIRQAKSAVQAELRADPAKATETAKRFGNGNGEGGK